MPTVVWREEGRSLALALSRVAGTGAVPCSCSAPGWHASYRSTRPFTQIKLSPGKINRVCRLVGAAFETALLADWARIPGPGAVDDGGGSVVTARTEARPGQHETGAADRTYTNTTVRSLAILPLGVQVLITSNICFLIWGSSSVYRKMLTILPFRLSQQPFSVRCRRLCRRGWPYFSSYKWLQRRDCVNRNIGDLEQADPLAAARVNRCNPFSRNSVPQWRANRVAGADGAAPTGGSTVADQRLRTTAVWGQTGHCSLGPPQDRNTPPN